MVMVSDKYRKKLCRAVMETLENRAVGSFSQGGKDWAALQLSMQTWDLQEGAV